LVVARVMEDMQKAIKERERGVVGAMVSLCLLSSVRVFMKRVIRIDWTFRTSR
jgi:hypothetical protein